MSNLVNYAISAVVGAISAVATVWFLSPNPSAVPVSTASSEATLSGDAQLQNLVVDSLTVRDSLALTDSKTDETTLEARDGSLYVKNGVYAEQLGAYRIMGQKIQTTPEDPLNEESPVFGEIATDEDGGAYLALLSPLETHSVTIGFDKNEKGCVVSQNNEDMSMVAQAIFVKPNGSDAETTASANTAASANNFATAQSGTNAVGTRPATESTVLEAATTTATSQTGEIIRR